MFVVVVEYIHHVELHWNYEKIERKVLDFNDTSEFVCNDNDLWEKILKMISTFCLFSFLSVKENYVWSKKWVKEFFDTINRQKRRQHIIMWVGGLYINIYIFIIHKFNTFIHECVCVSVEHFWFCFWHNFQWENVKMKNHFLKINVRFIVLGLNRSCTDHITWTIFGTNSISRILTFDEATSWENFEKGTVKWR